MARDRVTYLSSLIGRRELLRRGGAAALALGAGAAISGPARRAEAQAATIPMSMQFAWFLNSQAAGELVAIAKGYYRDAGIDLKMQPGGPSLDPIQVVAGGARRSATLPRSAYC